MIVDVKARKGRVAYTAAKGGVLIPQDRFISVTWSKWIERLEEVHGDIDIEDQKSSKKRKLELPQIVEESSTKEKSKKEKQEETNSFGDSATKEKV